MEGQNPFYIILLLFLIQYIMIGLLYSFELSYKTQYEWTEWEIWLTLVFLHELWVNHTILW